MTFTWRAVISITLQKDFLQRNFTGKTRFFSLPSARLKKSGLKKVFAIDYPYAEFSHDSLMAAMDSAGQNGLKMKIKKDIRDYVDSFNTDIQNLSLTRLLVKLNEIRERQGNIRNYIAQFNRGGKTDNFTGPYLVAEWYRRNLYMYSLIQKLTESRDKKVTVLLGAGHVAMLNELIKLDTEFRVVELQEVLK